jgi:single-stranded-DNA-specific exonuclease
MQPVWNIQNPDSGRIAHLCRHLSCHPATAAVLINRGIDNSQDAESFMNASLHHLDLSSPPLDMGRALFRIFQAVTRREPILIFGDYDTDGITATVILYEFLAQSGVPVFYYIPHRENEGYGLKPDHVRRFAAAGVIRLLITVDCGSGSHEAAEEAERSGIDLIITDHHRIIPPFPRAVAVINPQRTDNPPGMGKLAGVGVAFLLVLHLRRYFRKKGFWLNRAEPVLKPFCELVALGTVADMVPLREENRILVKTGLKMISESTRPGIHSLLAVSRLSPGRIRSEDIAFRLSPLLNATGRMDHADKAVRILLCQDSKSARDQANNIYRMNLLRRQVEERVVSELIQRIESGTRPTGSSSLVMAHSEWPIGILGIAASRLLRKYHRPVVLIHVQHGLGKGSARSIPGFDLVEGLFECRDCLEEYGGHQQAAGITIREKNIPRFQQRFDEIVRRRTAESDFIPMFPIDYRLDFDVVSPSLIDELEQMEPYGEGNPEPIFATENVSVVSSRVVGKNHRHLVLAQVTPTGEKTFPAIWFRTDTKQSPPRKLDQLAYRLRWNTWNGNRHPQIIVESALIS